MKSPEQRLADIDRRVPNAPVAPRPLPVLPKVIDFVTKSGFLDRPLLYPRQATLLKLWFLQPELFTDYDRRVVSEWESESEHDGSGLIGGYGVPTGILDRIAVCKADGRRWFSEIVAVMGRRGSKGYLGALAIAYVIATHLTTGDPRQHHGIAKDKTLVVPVFAGTKDQSQDNFWQDLRNFIVAAPFFQPYISEIRADKVLLWSHDQLVRDRDPSERPALEVVARESTENAGRGYAAIAQVFDEMAHTLSGGANRSADQLYVASQPSLNQFGKDAFTYLASSPRHKAGQFYESFTTALAVDVTGAPRYPQVFAFQFPSWEMYRDASQAHLLEMYPGGPMFVPINGPVIDEHDPEMLRIRQEKPEMWRVEFEAQWAEVDSPFLQRTLVDPMFEPWGERRLETQSRASNGHLYVAHVDLSLTGDNTALVIGHAEPTDDPARPHYVMDLIRVWKPQEFVDGHVNFRTVESDIRLYMEKFQLRRLTFDRWNSRSMIENLGDHARSLHNRVHVDTVPTTMSRNRELAEDFRTALYEGRVHSPYHSLARDELLYLRDDGRRVDHPSTGPCTTNDIAVCLFEVAFALAELAFDPGRRLSGVALRSGYSRSYGSQQEIFGALGGFPGGRVAGKSRARGGRGPR